MESVYEGSTANFASIVLSESPSLHIKLSKIWRINSTGEKTANDKKDDEDVGMNEDEDDENEYDDDKGDKSEDDKDDDNDDDDDGGDDDDEWR